MPSCGCRGWLTWLCAPLLCACGRQLWNHHQFCIVVGANSCGFDKFRTIARCVRYHRNNEADEVVCASFLFVRDLEEKWRQDLPDLREVGVGRLAVYWLELFKRTGEFCYDFFGRHSVRSACACLRERFEPLQRQALSLLALIIHSKK